MCCLFLSFLPNNLSCLVFRMPLLVFLLLWFLELITVRDSRLAGHPFFIASYILFIYFLEFARGSLSVFWVPKPLPVMVEDSVLCKGLFFCVLCLTLLLSLEPAPYWELVPVAVVLFATSGLQEPALMQRWAGPQWWGRPNPTRLLWSPLPLCALSCDLCLQHFWWLLFQIISGTFFF